MKIERILKIIRVMVTHNPMTTFQTLIRLNPKWAALLSAMTLILNLILKKLNISLPLNMLSGLNFMSTLFALGLVYEYKRLLPVNLSKKQIFLKKTSKKLLHSKTNKNSENLLFKHYDNFPVCVSKVTSARERGQLIAQDFAPQIIEIFDRYYNWLPIAIKLLYTSHSLGTTYKLPCYNQESPLYATNLETYLLKKFSEMNFKFPDHILEEFVGMLEVLTPYIHELNKNSIIARSVLTMDRIKLLVALPDILKMSPSEISVVHCTSAIRKLPNGSLEHLRTLDYASLGTLSQFTAVYAWLAPANSQDKPLALASVSFLPFIAALSITNGYLSATINDAATTTTKRFEKEGLPEILCLRYALEHCTTFEELDVHFQKHYPATTCSFTISSATDGRVYQMLPTDDTRYYTIRPLSDNGSSNNGSVVVTNHHYKSDPTKSHEVNPESINWPTTLKRERAAIQAINSGKSWNQVLKAVNVPETTHSLCFQYNLQRSLELKLSVQNYNAAACSKKQYHSIPISEILKDLQTTQCQRSAL